jgi:hypothetical protein
MKCDFSELIAKNIITFAKEIKNKNGQSVCPDCPKSKKEYNQKIQSVASGNHLAGFGIIIGVFWY